MDQTHPDITALLDARDEATRCKDLDRLMALYAPDIIYFDVVPPLQFVGAAALRARFADWLASFDGDLEFDTCDLRIDANGSLCFASMLTHARGSLKTGQQMAHWVRVTVCCRRSEHGWAIAHEHVSLPIDVGHGKA